jgi:ABC-type lipoprotein export system ATPase subunit
MVTHDPDVAAAADRTVHVLDGRIVDDGSARAAATTEDGP